MLKPHGVWAVISPFNFPMALSGGPFGAALVAGNAVVYKPSSDAPLCGVKLAEIADLAGLPHGVFNMVSGPGATVGAELQENEGVDGLLFTGSYEIGFNQRLQDLQQGSSPSRSIVEMGGKNPAIVSAHADLEEAAEGVMRSAFGYGGQKCSACSRVFVEAPVYEAFLEALDGQDEGHRRRRPDRPQGLAGAAGQRQGKGQVRGLDCRGEARRSRSWRAAKCSTGLRYRSVRGPDDRRGPAGRTIESGARSCSFRS